LYEEGRDESKVMNPMEEGTDCRYQGKKIVQSSCIALTLWCMWEILVGYQKKEAALKSGCPSRNIFTVLPKLCMKIEDTLLRVKYLKLQLYQ
jgi:hypothetical protein